LLEHCPTAALNTVESIRIDPDGVVVGRATHISYPIDVTLMNRKPIRIY
jgi:hypothetical protein